MSFYEREKLEPDYAALEKELSAVKKSLRVAVEYFQDLSELLVMEDIGHYGNGYNRSMKDYCLEALSKIKGE